MLTDIQKDTVVGDDDVTELVARFDYEATDEHPHMLHCHTLDHEDYRMIWQYTVGYPPHGCGTVAVVES